MVGIKSSKIQDAPRINLRSSLLNLLRATWGCTWTPNYRSKYYDMDGKCQKYRESDTRVCFRAGVRGAKMRARAHVEQVMPCNQSRVRYMLSTWTHISVRSASVSHLTCVLECATAGLQRRTLSQLTVNS